MKPAGALSDVMRLAAEVEALKAELEAAQPMGGRNDPATKRHAHGRSGDDVGGQLVLDEGDAIAELQFSLFQALNLQYVGAGGVLQGLDGDVEIPMLLHQPRQIGPELVFLLFGHCR